MSGTDGDDHQARALAIPVIERVVDYWRGRAAGRAMPARADIDPVIQVPRLVPHLSLVEVRPGPRRFYVRVLGAASMEHRHDLKPRNLAWHYLEDVPLHNRKDETLAAFARVADGGAPAYLAWSYQTSGGGDAEFGCALLPLGAEGRVTHVLVGAYYSDTQHLMLAERNRAPTAAAA